MHTRAERRTSLRLDLNGEWEARMPDGEMRTVPVPGCFDRGLGRWDEARPVRYRRTFRLEKREPAELFFGGVSYACEISLNDVSLGGHEGLWDGFWVDTRDALREGENELTVVVTKPGYDSNDAYPLRQVLSGFIPDVLATFGGLWDDVALETASPSAASPRMATRKERSAWTRRFARRRTERRFRR